jgi:hypothetical protein
MPDSGAAALVPVSVFVTFRNQPVGMSTGPQLIVAPGMFDAICATVVYVPADVEEIATTVLTVGVVVEDSVAITTTMHGPAVRGCTAVPDVRARLVGAVTVNAGPAGPWAPVAPGVPCGP